MLLASKRWCFTTRKHSFCKSVDYFSSFHLICIDFSSLSFSKIIARFVLVWWPPFVKKVSILAGAVSCLLRGYRDKSIVKWIEMYIRKQAHKLCCHHFLMLTLRSSSKIKDTGSTWTKRKICNEKKLIILFFLGVDSEDKALKQNQ